MDDRPSQKLEEKVTNDTIGKGNYKIQRLSHQLPSRQGQEGIRCY